MCTGNQSATAPKTVIGMQRAIARFVERMVAHAEASQPRLAACNGRVRSLSFDPDFPSLIKVEYGCDDAEKCPKKSLGCGESGEES